MLSHFFWPFRPGDKTWRLDQWFAPSLTSALVYQKNCPPLWGMLLRCWQWWMNFGFCYLFFKAIKLAMWLWAFHFPSLDLSFNICKIRALVQVTSQVSFPHCLPVWKCAAKETTGLARKVGMRMVEVGKHFLEVNMRFSICLKVTYCNNPIPRWYF